MKIYPCIFLTALTCHCICYCTEPRYFSFADFLILFFTEALFYSGVAIFVLLTDYMQKPHRTLISITNNPSKAGIGHRISSVATLVLSLIIPLVTMGLVWPWTGPAASATLAPYLVGLIVQFAFEQYARYKKSVAWPVIPVIFQVRTYQSVLIPHIRNTLSITIIMWLHMQICHVIPKLWFTWSRLCWSLTKGSRYTFKRMTFTINMGCYPKCFQLVQFGFLSPHIYILLLHSAIFLEAHLGNNQIMCIHIQTSPVSISLFAEE